MAGAGAVLLDHEAKAECRGFGRNKIEKVYVLNDCDTILAYIPI